MLRFLVLAFLLMPNFAFAKSELTGVWQSVEEDIRLDILDGFKPNRGAVLSIEKGEETEVGSWESNEQGITLSVGWSSDEVQFIGTDTIEWRRKRFTRSTGITEEGVVLLKGDENAFIDQLTGGVWLTSDEGENAIFKSTFSIDSGVLALYARSGELESLRSWGISSGVLKIGDSVIVEARISENYLVGQDHRDSFVVFRAAYEAEEQGRIELSKQREDFLSNLLTDTWQRPKYGGGYYYYKFRSVEGPLKGRVLHLENDTFKGSSVWEYSPSTGALKIGYTDYIGGIAVGDTLALLEEDGDQVFYHKKPDGPGKVFSVSDVRTYRVNEVDLGDLNRTLDGQFQRDGYLYSFEFKDDGRTGYVHKWRSEPFFVTGQRFASDAFYPEAEIIYELEEYLLFDDVFAVKRDATESRLKPKTDAQVAEDRQAMEKKMESLGQTSVVLRVTDLEGNVQDFMLPFRSMADIEGIELVTR